MEGAGVMATVSRTVCDVHLMRGEEVDATTRGIELDGEKARVDLCDSCYQETIGPVLNLINQLRSTKPPTKAPTKKVATKKVATKNVVGKRSRERRGPSPAAIRKWAQEQGIDVSASGRLPREIRDQYVAAH
jgi:hypothetical protein